MALFESGDDDYIFIFFVKSCKVRTTAAAAAARSAFAARCALRVSLCCIHVRMLAPLI